jgi:predicted amidohydrolase
MANIVKAALLQTDWTGDKESMIVKHEEAAREAAAQGAQIICFQELFYGPYFCQVQDAEYYEYTEYIPDGPTTKRFQALAKELNMVMVLPMYEIEQLARHERPKGSVDGLNARELMEPYWDEYEAIEIDGDARHASRFALDVGTGEVIQTIHDPEGHDEWRVLGLVDLDASRAEDRLVIGLNGIVRK